MKKKASPPPAEGRETSRRRLLQLLAVGGVFAGGKMLPETWVKPVVGEVMLPAHAQTSPPDEQEPDLILEDDTDADTTIGP